MNPAFHILQDCFTVEGEDLKHDFERLQLGMEMVGFLPATRKQWVTDNHNKCVIRITSIANNDAFILKRRKKVL